MARERKELYIDREMLRELRQLMNWELAQWPDTVLDPNPHGKRGGIEVSDSAWMRRALVRDIRRVRRCRKKGCRPYPKGGIKL